MMEKDEDKTEEIGKKEITEPPKHMYNGVAEREDSDEINGAYSSSENGFDTDDEELDDNDPQTTTGSNEDLKGLVGLLNLGNTCYMNGALQALSNCQQLTRFVLDYPEFTKEQGLCRNYSELMREIWHPKNSQYVVPTRLITNIKCIYPAFRGCTQQDTQEFLRCFLEQLHDELKLPIQRRSKSKIAANENYKNNTDLDSSQSIISEIFAFKISSSVVCSNCNNISSTVETFKDLSIPIPSRDHPYYSSQRDNDDLNSEFGHDSIGKIYGDSKTTHIKYNSDQNEDDCYSEKSTDNCQELQQSHFNSIPLAGWIWSWWCYLKHWLWGPEVTLQDCLSIFFGTDPLEGDNEYSCEVCTKKNRGVKFLKILDLPEVLCIHFKRYESIGSAKIMTHVSFPMTGLDLSPYVSEKSVLQCTTYDLIACICHHGSALLTGHYTTYALNCFDDQWYEFDDQYVTSVEDYQVENSEAYILFYQKSTLDSRTERQRVKASKLLKKSLSQSNLKKYFISKQWVNKFNTFVEPGPITNYDFLCEHKRVRKTQKPIVSELCHPISETVWKYLRKLHGGGPECQELLGCDICE